MYCVKNGNISLRSFVLLSRADCMRENLTSESNFSISLLGILFLAEVLF